ncbi:DUF6493 family protein, partial [Actinoplanes sp. NPDC049596]|uniref:DUF6493 family protein n=1 Tax=Actinoplanes sp. NPDC049596 TaxID=3154625 RepID=UPI003442A603
MATATEKHTRQSSRPPGYDEFVRLLDEGDADDVADALLHLDEPRRRALVPRIRAVNLATGSRPGHTSDRSRREGALLVAGAGCLATVEDVVAWLRSPRFKGEFTSRTIAAAIRVLQAPGRPGLATVATDLATHLKNRDHDRGEWALTAAALRAAGLPPPATEQMLRGWVRHFSPAASAGALAARLAEDPWLEDLLPALFATPKVATDLDDTWPAALALLAAGKRIDRRDLLALLVARLRSGDRGAALRPVLDTFRHLDPTPAERAAHHADFLAMLAEPSGPVAELAQRILRALDDGGHLDAGTVVAATRAALARTEKKLIRAQIAWLDRAISRHPEAAPTLLEAATSILDSDDPEVAERALRVVGHHNAGPAALRPAAETLTGDLRRQADEILGVPAIPSAPHFPPAPVPSASPPMPPAIASLPELTATLAQGPLSPVDLERALAAVVKFATSARTDLAWALAPHTTDQTSPLAPVIQAVVPPGLARPKPTPQTYAPLGARRRPANPPAAPREGIAARPTNSPPPIATSGPAALRPATAAPDANAAPATVASAGATWSSRASQTLPPPQEMLRLRIQELADQLAAGDGPPALLATPATQDGHVDPARLLLRLASAERAGWQPGPYDLAQALLRLPRECPPQVHAAAARLNATAGRRFA